MKDKTSKFNILNVFDDDDPDDEKEDKETQTHIGSTTISI
jgi:hypothetical protein